MKKFILIVLLSLFLFTFAEEASDVITLDDKNFEEEIKKHEYMLLEFYAPWCGHCKQLAPHYEKVATELKGVIAVAKLDADAHRKEAERFGIQGFPTIKLLRKGEPIKDYEGPRSVKAMVSWVKKQTGPAAKTLNSQEELDNFVKDNKNTALVGFFKDAQDPEYLAFLEVLKKFKIFDDFPAAAVLGNAELSKEFGSEPAIKLFRSFDAPVSIKGAELQKLKEFVTSNGYPLVEEISGQNFQRFVEAGLPVAVLFSDLDKKEEFEGLLSEIKKAAETLKGKFIFSYTNGVTYKEQLNAMGGDGSKLPGVAAMDITKRLNFPYSGEIEAKALTAWAEGIISGTVKPYLKSQPVPEKQEGPVYVVVGKSFEEIVYDKTKDVLVEFYAPWCGHCKSLEPIYNKLGEVTKDVKNLVIAKIDATENDTPISIEGFPTLYFFPSNNKDKPLQYDSGRNLASFVKYLQDNGVASKEGMSKVNVPAEEETKSENNDLSDEMEPEEEEDKKVKHDEL